MRTPIPFSSVLIPNVPIFRLLSAPVLIAALLCGTQILAAEPQAANSSSAPTRKLVYPHKRRPAARVKPAVPQVAAAPTEPVAPPAPELPKWPVNEKPTDAAVTWDSQGLRIEAQNSSLRQILHDVSTATGTKVDGLGTDERVFGAFGPGQARDVISQLLQGSGYNVIMIGDQGQGSPRQIVLSTRKAGAGDAQSAATPNQATPGGDEDADNTEDTPPTPPPPFRPGFGPGIQPRTPQQIMQEMQQHQQQLQQQNQQNAPPQP